MRVPVVDINAKALMPTKPGRARRWIKEGKAIGKWSKLGIFYVQLKIESSDNKTQDIAVGIDPGKHFSGVAVQSKQATLFTAHLELPFKNVTKRLTQRAMMRRTRRSRRINRKLPFNQRAHRQKRFNNRKQGGMPPSIRSNKLLELRILKLITDIFPVTDVVYEVVKARGDKGFSPVMVGQKMMLEYLEVIKNKGYFKRVKTMQGFDTHLTRKHLNLEKEKGDKSLKIPQTHAVDGIALAASKWISYGVTSTKSQAWRGEVKLTDCWFSVISRPPVCKRQLHLLQCSKGGKRRKYGGSTTRHGFRKGDYVEAVKAGKTYRGWVSGDTVKMVAINDSNWKQGQYTASKVKLIKRSTGLVVTTSKLKPTALAERDRKVI
ncbi:MAG: RRXRR domain-containing protein [Rivularia sp. (in: cyanobacteria)]|jgi:hypothetical protein